MLVVLTVHIFLKLIIFGKQTVAGQFSLTKFLLGFACIL